jgi:hypothetical protein
LRRRPYWKLTRQETAIFPSCYRNVCPIFTQKTPMDLSKRSVCTFWWRNYSFKMNIREIPAQFANINSRDTASITWPIKGRSLVSRSLAYLCRNFDVNATLTLPTNPPRLSHAAAAGSSMNLRGILMGSYIVQNGYLAEPWHFNKYIISYQFLRTKTKQLIVWLYCHNLSHVTTYLRSRAGHWFKEITYLSQPWSGEKYCHKQHCIINVLSLAS